MGRLNKEVEQKANFMHFSHNHPLDFSILSEGAEATCFGCGVEIIPRMDYYSCRTCGFSLHKLCYNLPMKIHHPADSNHNLVLVPLPSFQCKACGKEGSGFSYDCKICKEGYHCLCTLHPTSISHPSHAHQLNLEFASPYGEGKGFRCDICNLPGSNSWLYCCRTCGFDVHLHCATSKTKAPIQSDSQKKQDTEASFVCNRGLTLPTNYTLPSHSLYPSSSSNGLLLQENQNSFNQGGASQANSMGSTKTISTNARVSFNPVIDAKSQQDRPSAAYYHKTNTAYGGNVCLAGSTASNQPIFLGPKGSQMPVYYPNRDETPESSGSKSFGAKVNPTNMLVNVATSGSCVIM